MPPGIGGIAPMPPPGPPLPNSFIGACISAFALVGASSHTAPSMSTPSTSAATVARTNCARDTPPRMAHAIIVNTTPNTAAPNVPACESAVKASSASAIAPRRSASPRVVDASARAVPTHAAAMNTIAIDCFSKSPVMRRMGALSVAIVAAAMAAGSALRRPPLHTKVAAKITHATSGCATLSTTRVDHMVA